ncbi:hypothetical protein [Pseudomonas huanghezhanensis]|uniref:hypothetical protein n=1 Tax=Pseudomonas huanghezhanensis TaxID=3002903 RepID=UPI0022867DF9|nr:hypothetical protein [Pseudomonas sp. BSw22131]
MFRIKESAPTFDGLPRGLPEEIHATWRGALAALRAATDPLRVAEGYHFCCGFLQALADARVIEPIWYTSLRSQLLEVWVEAVNRLNQDAHDIYPLR